jgi:hypothetical protein
MTDHFTDGARRAGRLTGVTQMIDQSQEKPKRAKQVYVRWPKDCPPAVVIKKGSS